MLVLAFDSAGAGASAAVRRDGTLVASRSAKQARGQAEILMPMIAAVLDEAGVAATALDLIGVTVGPGSFTGLRIAIAAARGLALAVDVPALGISSFRAIAAQMPPARRAGRPLLVALDTRRADFYLQLFAADDAATGEAVLATVDDAARWLLPGRSILVAGDAATRLAAALPAFELAVVADSDQARAADIALLAAADVRAGIAPTPPRPIYLRAPDVTMPRAPRSR